MIANNAAGPHALLYGSTRDHVKELNVVLANGTLKNSKNLSSEMHSYVQEIQKHKTLILNSKRNVDKNSSGYYLEGLLEEPASFEKLFVGSEGTLALVTQATLNIVPVAEKISFAVFGFESMGKALMAVKTLKESNACCIELLDGIIMNVIRTEYAGLMRELGLENAKAALWVEWNDDVPTQWKPLASYLSSDIPTIRNIWNQRSKVSKWLHAQAETQNRKPLRCIEDACVPLESLVQFVMGLNDLMERHDCKGAIFGHVGNGHLHVNPSIRTDIPNLEERVIALMKDFHELVDNLGGTISGEHGDGMLRVEYAKKQWKEIWPLFEFVKRSFDPKGIFNPDRKVPIKNSPWPKIRF
jgi:FAD/FMN-containing dehydrogenase